MLKTTIFISTLLTVSLTVYSQDLKLKCGDKEIDCLNGNKSHFEMVVHCPYHYQNIVSFGIGYDAPKFCDNCGNRYPWTETQLQVTRELIELADEINTSKKEDLNLNIEELVKESPKVPVAQIKVKKLLSKVDKNISDGIHDALAKIISETIQKNIWNKPTNTSFALVADNLRFQKPPTESLKPLGTIL